MKSSGRKVSEQAAALDRQLRLTQAAHQDQGKSVSLDRHQMRPQIVGETNAYGVVRDASFKEPSARLRDLQRLRQHLPKEHHFDTAMTHGVDKGQVLDPGLLDPDDVVKKQFMAIEGVRRASAAPGRWTRTRRSFPTSE